MLVHRTFLLVLVEPHMLWFDPSIFTFVPNVCVLSEFRVFVTDFTCFYTFQFLYAQLSVVAPIFLRLHLNLGCHSPFGGEKKLLIRFLPFFLFVATMQYVNLNFSN